MGYKAFGYVSFLSSEGRFERLPLSLAKGIVELLNTEALYGGQMQMSWGKTMSHYKLEALTGRDPFSVCLSNFSFSGVLQDYLLSHGVLGVRVLLYELSPEHRYYGAGCVILGAHSCEAGVRVGAWSLDEVCRGLFGSVGSSAIGKLERSSREVLFKLAGYSYMDSSRITVDVFQRELNFLVKGVR